MNSTRQTSIHLLLQGSIVRTQEIYRAAPQGPDIRSRQFPLTSFWSKQVAEICLQAAFDPAGSNKVVEAITESTGIPQVLSDQLAAI